MTNAQNVERNETMLKALVETTSLRNVASAFHNIFAHGEILESEGLDGTDEQLEEIFVGIDKMLAVLDELQA